MQQISTLVQAIRKGFLALALISLISFTGFGIASQPSYAANSAAPNLTQSQQAESVENRVESYEEAKEIAADPKRGAEKEYEKNIEAYREEHAGQGGLVEGVKEIVTEVTGNK